MKYFPFGGGCCCCGTFWGTELNESGFMGFVDKWWILMNRICAILSIVCLCVLVVEGLEVVVLGKKEGFYTSRLRHLNKRYV